jgi:hypothetical protein
MVLLRTGTTKKPARWPGVNCGGVTTESGDWERAESDWGRAWALILLLVFEGYEFSLTCNMQGVTARLTRGEDGGVCSDDRPDLIAETIRVAAFATSHLEGKDAEPS